MHELLERDLVPPAIGHKPHRILIAILIGVDAETDEEGFLES